MPAPHVIGFGGFLRTFFGYLRPHRNKAILLLGLRGVDVALKTAWPLSFKVLIDHAVGERNDPLLFGCLGGLLVAVILAMACAIIRDYVHADVGSRVLHDIRARLLAARSTPPPRKEALA